MSLHAGRRIVATNLARVMKEKRISRRQLERQSGVSTSMIGYVLREETGVTIDLLERIAAGVGCTLADLVVAGDETMPWSADQSFLSLHYAYSRASEEIRRAIHRLLGVAY